MANGVNLQGFNVNPVTNPTHPAHDMATRHFGAALGHLLIGDGETAAHHIGQAIGHTLAPHMPEGTDHAAVGAAVTDNIRQAAHGGRQPARPRARKKKRS